MIDDEESEKTLVELIYDKKDKIKIMKSTQHS